MSRRSITVRQLANQFGLDLDETLVALWEAGLEGIEDVDDRIAPSRIPRAHRALGLSNLRQFRKIEYWQNALNLPPDDLRSKLGELGISVSPEARVLPKGALAKLRRAGLDEPKLSAITAAVDEAVGNDVDEEPVEPEFRWPTIGAPRSCAHLSVDEVQQIHEILEREFSDTTDPIIPAGVRDVALLESAVFRSTTRLGDERKYPSAPMVAAALLHSLTHNHPFFNGNKRTALVAMLVSLDRNGTLLTCDQNALFRHVLLVAQHRIVPRTWSSLADREVSAIAQWICENSRQLSRGERAIKWRELRKILTSRYECTIDGPLPGNRLKIRRTVRRKRLFGWREQELIAHGSSGGDGREVGASQLHHIRASLELDDGHGFDSAYFYGTDAREPDEFVAEYRNILKRLAKL